MERIMTNVKSTLYRWGIASILMLAATGSTGVARASDADAPAAALPSVSASAASAEPAPRMAPSQSATSNCSFSAPCVIERSSSGWELDYGGPGRYFDRTSDD